MLDVAVLAPAFVTMFVVIDPIGLSPLFIALTSGMDARQRRAIGQPAGVRADSRQRFTQTHKLSFPVCIGRKDAFTVPFILIGDLVAGSKFVACHRRMSFPIGLMLQFTGHQCGQPVGYFLDNGIRHAVNCLRLQPQVNLIVDVVHRQKLVVPGQCDLGGKQVQAAHITDAHSHIIERAQTVAHHIILGHRVVNMGFWRPPTDKNFPDAIDNPEPGWPALQQLRLDVCLHQILVIGEKLPRFVYLIAIRRFQHHPLPAAAQGWLDRKTVAQR